MTNTVAFLAVLLLFCSSNTVWSFSPSLPSLSSHSRLPTFLNALSPERKKVLLSRTGPYFSLDRLQGTIEFGATAKLTTQLGSKDNALVTAWLRDEESLALSIWDPQLTTAMGNRVYRLQTMALQFVTMKCSPWVDVEMKTVESSRTGAPIFAMQSVGFDPNIEVLPGMRVDGDSLGIVIETAGYLRLDDTKDGCVSGSIAFQTKGSLPPPLRLLPDGALRTASDAINNQIVKLAIENFEKGARKNFDSFMKQQKLSI